MWKACIRTWYSPARAALPVAPLKGVKIWLAASISIIGITPDVAFQITELP